MEVPHGHPPVAGAELGCASPALRPMRGTEGQRMVMGNSMSLTVAVPLPLVLIGLAIAWTVIGVCVWTLIRDHREEADRG